MTAPPRGFCAWLIGWASIAVYLIACAIDWARTGGRSVDGYPARKGNR